MTPAVQRKPRLAILSLLAILLSPLCLLAQQPPTSLRYPTPNVYIAGVSNVYLAPTVSGNVSTYSVSPGLPTGISLNTNTGVISGTPTTASGATTYTVTATNASGSTNTTLSIQVTTSYYNNAFAQVSFTGASSTSISGSGTGQTVNDKILYSSVATISGTQIDAIVTTTRATNVTSWVAYDQNAASGGGYDSNDPKFFSPQVNFGTGGGTIGFTVQFILGGSYNATTNPTGTPVILQSVYFNSYDIDGNGNNGSNQYNLVGDFNQFTLGSPSQIAVSYDAPTGLTRFRSTTDQNNATITADAHRIRLSFNNLSTLPIILGAESNGAAYFFLDFSAGPAFTTSTTNNAPTLDLGTAQTGVNNDSAGCASAIPFARGTTNVSTPTNNSFDSLVVNIPSAQLLNGTSEQLVVNGATAGSPISLGSDVSTTVTLGGVNYTTTSVLRNGTRYVKFARSGTTAAQLEALIDALQYRNISSAATNGTRTFTVNAYNAVAASPDAVFSATVSCVTISGNIWHDANGLSDATVNANGSPTITANFAYAVLVSQATNQVLASTAISAGGGYSFNTVDPGNYYIYVRNSAATVGQTITSASYPSGSSGAYVSTGENLASTSGNDGLTDGKIVVTLGSSSVTSANFGIELPPTTASSTINSVANPGGFNYYTVPVSSGFTYADEDGTVSSITVTSFPTGANYIRLNGILYTNGGTCPPQSTCTAFPAAGVVVPAANISAIAVDPTSTGAGSVVIPFRATDNAGINDVTASPSTVTINFIAQAAPITVSGNVWDDVNGNGSKDVAEVYAAPANGGQTLYALLVQTTNTYSGASTIYASTPVTAAAVGYSFSNVPSGNNYEVRLASLAAAPTDGVALSTITQSLPTGWTDVSYNNNGTISTGLNVTTPSISLGLVTASKPSVNFGVDALPTAVTTGATAAVNPGGTNNATVPATSFSGTDAADLAGGQISYVRISSFPTNATSITITGSLTPGGAVTTTTYTSSSFPAGGVYVATTANGNLANASAVLVDPVNGAPSVVLSYKVVDNANIESSNTATATINFSELTISGSVYNDVNAGTINGTLISSAGGQLYVNLVNTQTGTVIASKTVTGGTYSFNTSDGLQSNIGTYTLVLAGSASATSSTLPSSAWTYTAEGITNTTGDGAANGTYVFGANVAANAVIDFGLDALPTTTALTVASSQQNPGGTNNVTIPANTFTGTDADAGNGGTISYIHITSFPANATSITLTGSTTIGGAVATTTYTSGTFPAGGIYVATNGSGNPLTAVLVDPVNGAVNVDVSYAVVDNAGKESLATGAARQPLTDFSISGSVYDDPDAGIINGTLRSNAGGQLYVNLVSGGVLVASKAVDGAGTYSFSTADGLQNNVSGYSLVLTNTAVATTSTLPSAAFTYTAEGLPGSTGDGTANGTYTFAGTVTSNTSIDFGIDALPTVTALTTATSQVNPGGTTTITVPASTFSGADAGDLSGGSISYIWLTTFPSNATSITVTGATSIGGAISTASYTSGTFPAGGIYIASNGSGNPSSAITVDPAVGAVNVDFSYRTIDNAGKPSTATGIARQPLSDLTISGTVYDDADGATDNIIDGTAISIAGGQLYVNLVNTATNTVLASKTLTNGTYSFGTADGVQNNISTYAVVLTSTAAGTTGTLPSAAWTHTGEGLSGGSGDGNANGSYSFGSVVTSNKVVDFGIDALPAPAALTTAVAQTNPGGTATVTIPATTFNGTDLVDLSGGRINYIHILNFPANATTVSFAAAATTVGGATSNVTYTSANFPVGGVYVATNASGNPSSAITVDPVNGAVNVDFTYRVIDNALQESSTSGIARQPLTDLTISGSVYDDVNGGTINGSLISSAGGQLYVNLVNTATNTVLSSKAVSSGTYSFGTADGLQNDISTYRLVLTSTAVATGATLPTTGWVYMAEGLSASTGDGTANGIYDLAGVVSSSVVVDFAIEALPVPATLTTAIAQVNPGGTSTVTIPASTFVASDATDLSGGAVSFIHITSFPTNTTTVNFANASTSVNGTYGALSYTSGTFPVGGVYVATNSTGNPTSAITVDPVNGPVNVDFTFTAIDNSGKESITSGTARQPLSDLVISGTVYDDANGTKDNTINGTAVGSLSGTQMYVNLVSGGVVVASQALPTAGGTTGTFSFGTANGATSGTSYTIVLANSAVATTGILPSGWVNTAEGITAAGDGSANGVNSAANVTTSQTVNFGVNILPTVSNNTTTAQANPGGTNLVAVPASAFTSADADINGGIAFVHVTAFPGNVTSITVYGSTTVNGTPTSTSYTSGTFPAGGIYIPTSNAGLLVPTDALKLDPAAGAVSATVTFEVVDIAGYTSATTAVATIPFVTGAISGSVFNDFDALTDGLVDGTGTNLSGALFVNVLNNSNTLVASSAVNSDGTYLVSGLGNGNYTLVLTTTNVATAAALPSGWVNTGEGTVAAGDGTVNGLISITLSSNGVANANFGIDARPVANTTSATSQVNPGGTNTITIPATSFSGSDADASTGGEIDYVHITSFPTNVTSITVIGSTTAGGAVTTTTYTFGTFPAGGVYIATANNGNLLNASAVLVDPVNGNNSIVITYQVVDNAGQQSTSPATLTQPLSDLVISGTVYDDVNGGIISGTAISNAGGPLYVNLVSSGVVVASYTLTNGTFSFSTANGLQNNINSYQLILANSPTATVASLPSAAWVYLAEGITGSTGDGTANGTYAFSGNVTSNQVIDFAIDARPTAVTAAAVAQVNPGGTNSVTVPANTFSGTDAVDVAGGAISYVHIMTFPSNATSITITGALTAGGAVTTTTYTSGTFPAGGVYIATDANGNLSTANAVQVDPLDGAVTVAISYKVMDNSGVESSTAATASQPFSDLVISGTVYDDADGTSDALIDGTAISNADGQLYVNLVNAANGTVVASKLLTNGTYSFGTADGLDVNVTTYQIVLANSASALAPALPNASTWTFTSEGISGTVGDGFPNGRYQVGALSTSRVVDFGIDALPMPVTITTATSKANPGGTNTVTVPASIFVASDAVDLAGGQVNYIHITSFPTNATTVNFANASTSVNGTYGALSYTSLTFPAGGVYVATNTVGNPTSAISIDPVDGAVNVDFTFTAIDNAGKESISTGTARQPLSDLLISGTVSDDVDAGVINGTPISSAGGQLYVNLVNTANNSVVASKQLTDGTFSFGTADGVLNNVATYRIVLTKTALLTVASLPSAGWVNTAEGATGTSGDGTANGTYDFSAAVTSNTVIDLGLDARPIAVPLTVATPKVNPGGSNFIGIANNLPLGSDPVDVSGGQVALLHVISFPTDIDAVRVNAATTPGGALSLTTYTAATWPLGGIYVATNASGATLDSFFIDPINGADTVEIQFRSIDQAGVESLNIGLGKIPITELTITGNVYNDVNGNTDGTVNGTLISNAGGQLFVNLVNSATSTVVSSKTVIGGAFSFSTADGLQNDIATYYLVLAATPTATASALPAPAAWTATGEGAGAVPDGLPNGRYTLSAVMTAPLVVAFGIDARPVTDALITASSQLNPGGTASVTVPPTTFAGTDADAANGGVISYIHITAFPTNATSMSFGSAGTTIGGAFGAVSYTAATFPAGGVYVATNASGNPSSSISVDPVDGAVNVDITYFTIDNAHVASNASGIARQPFSALLISGNVYDDYNGLTDNLLNGVLTNAGGTIYVNALDGNGVVLASAAVAANGSWTIDELTPGTYSLVLSTSPSNTVAAVPAGWAIIGEGDGTTPDALANGVASVTLAASNVTGIRFAIEKFATADAKTFILGPNNNPNIVHVTVPSTANAANSYAALINLSGAASSGSTPGALTGLDPDGNAGAALTLTQGTANVTVLIDPASYSGVRNGQVLLDAIMVQYAGIQLQPGGCQGSDVGNGACSLYNSATGYWEIPAYDLSQLKVLIRNGASSASFDYAWRDAAGITGTFDTYTIGFEQNLPVHLITFTGEKRGSNALLNWSAGNEQNFRGYGVERSTDGINFSQVGFVNGRGLQGVQHYNYNDDLRGINASRVYYRLKQLDLNGTFEYSNVVTIRLDAQGIEPGVTLLSNPVRSQVRVQVRTASATNASFTLVDGSGRVVYRKQQSMGSGTTALTVEVPAMLTSGVYYLLTQFDGQQFSNKVLVDR